MALADCPVITLKDDYCINENLGKILLPIDSTYETRQKVPFTTALAKAFNAEMIVLSVYPTSVDYVKNLVNQYSEQTITFLKNEKVKHSLQIAEAKGNIPDTVINIAKANKVNLISIMTEQETNIQYLWLGTYAHQRINCSPIPILSLHSKNIFEISTR